MTLRSVPGHVRSLCVEGFTLERMLLACSHSARLLQDTTDSNEHHSHQDTVTAATSVFVAPPGSDAAVAASVCGAAGGLSANPTWLTYLAIAFGVLFAIMLFINIFLCRQVYSEWIALLI